MHRQKSEWFLRIFIVITIVFQTSGLIIAKGPGYLAPAAGKVESWPLTEVPEEFFSKMAATDPPLSLPVEVSALGELIPPGMTVAVAQRDELSSATIAVPTNSGELHTMRAEMATISPAGGAISFFDAQLLLLILPGTFTTTVEITLEPLPIPAIATAAEHTWEPQPVDGVGIPGRRREVMRFQLHVQDSADKQPVNQFGQSLLVAIDARDYQNEELPWSIETTTNNAENDWQTTAFNQHHPQGIMSVALDAPATLGVVGTEGSISWRYNWEPPTANEFSGAAVYQHALELPPGRGGLQPQLTLAYNSRGVDSLTLAPADQGPLGLGFSLRQTAVVRTRSEIGVQNGAYKVTLGNQFGLQFQGAYYELQLLSLEENVAHYLAINAPWLRVRQIYDSANLAGNIDRLFWIVTGADGTSYRLGNSVTATQGITASGAGVSFTEEAGQLQGAADWGALTWLVDTVSDVHGNQIQYDYFAAPDIINEYYGTYLRTEVRRPLEIRYNYKETALANDRLSGEFPNDFATRIQFELNPGMNHRVDAINLFHLDYVSGDKPYQRYDFGLGRYNAPFLCGQTGIFTETLLSMEQQGYDQTGQFFRLPPINFNYQSFGHGSIHDIDGDGPEESERCYRYAYLQNVGNGYGGEISFNYAADGRLSAGWQCDCIPAFGHSYFVTEIVREDGVNPPARTLFDSFEPCYDALTGDVGNLASNQPYCPQSVITEDYPTGALVGFAEVHVVTHEYDQDLFPGPVVNIVKTAFHLAARRMGRPRWREIWSAENLLLKRQDFTYLRDAEDIDGDGALDFDFTHTSQECSMSFIQGGQSSEKCTSYAYGRFYNRQFGNLTQIMETGFSPGQGWRQKLTTREYIPDPSLWLINFLAREAVFTAPVGVEIDPLAQTPLTDTRYYYDNQNSFQFPPLAGNLTQVEQLLERENHPTPPPPTDIISGAVYGFTETWKTLSGVDVFLLDENEVIWAAGQTDDQGIYYFYDLPAESFTVVACDYVAEMNSWVDGVRPSIIAPQYGTNIYVNKTAGPPQTSCPAQKPAPLPTNTAAPPTPIPTGTSSPPPPATLTPTPATETIQLTPLADTYVDEIWRRTAFGQIPQIQLRHSPAQIGYMQFDLRPYFGQISSVTLRLHSLSDNNAGFGLYLVSDDQWTETVSFLDAPDPGPLVASSGPLVAGSWVEIDLSAAVTTPELFSFALLTESDETITLASRENSVAPELRFEISGLSATLTPPAPTPTPSPPTPTPSVHPPNPTLPAPGVQQELPPVADALVQENRSDRNFGLMTLLAVDPAPETMSYLQFDIPPESGAISAAVLRIYANDAATAGISVLAVESANWQEATITYANAPAITTEINRSGPFSAGSWVAIDLFTYIQVPGSYTVALTSLDGQRITFSSRESDQPPALQITSAPEEASFGEKSGRLMRTVLQESPLQYAVIQASDFDLFGNAIRMEDANGRATQIAFDNQYNLYPVTVENTLGHTSIFKYNGLNATYFDGPPGTLRESLDANGQSIFYFYDPFNRLTKQFNGWQNQCQSCAVGDSNAIFSRPSQAFYYADDAVPFRIDSWTKTENDAVQWFDGGIVERQFFDGFGNMIQSQHPHQDWGHSTQTGLYQGQKQITDLFYNALGQQVRQSQPYLVPETNQAGGFYVNSNSSPIFQEQLFDSLGRPLRSEDWNGSITTNLFGNKSIYVENGLGHVKATYLDDFGNVSAVDDLLTIYKDSFADNSLPGWQQTGDNNVTASGVTLSAATSQSAIWRSIPQGGDYGVLVTFRTGTTAPLAGIYIDYNAGNTGNYRRWGMLTGDFDGDGIHKINLQEVQDDNGVETTPLLPFQSDTTYRMLLRGGQSDAYYVILLWEEDNPDHLSEIRLPRDAGWGGNPRFVTDVSQGSLTIVDYQEIAFHRTEYRYDLLDQLIQVIDPLDNITNMIYDAAGRKRLMQDPDMGEWHYIYDNAGNMTAQINPHNQTLLFAYDGLNRLMEKRLAPSSGNRLIASYSYDQFGPENQGRGQRTGMQTYDVLGNISTSASWEYDAHGQVTKELRQVYDQTYLFKFTYSQGGLPLTVTYPGGANGESGETVVTNYWWQTGQPRTMIGDGVYVSEAAYETSAGLPSALQLANGITTFFHYDSALHLQALFTETAMHPEYALDFGYTYDLLGNLTTITDRALPGGEGNQTQTFTFDSLNRLVTAVTGGQNTGQYAETIQYDSLGNIIHKNGQVFGYASEFSAPHTLTHIDDQQLFWYDETGNMVRRIDEQEREWQYQWTAENKLAAAHSDEGDDIQFIYDADGMLIMRVEDGGTVAEKSTIMLGKLMEHDSLTGFRKQYLFNGRLLAVRTGLQVSSEVNFLLRDHLGSVNTTLWADGSERGNKRYTPWGKERWSVDVTPTQARFTAQRWDAGLGLLDYNARYYDPAIGRFISADPIIPGMRQTALAVDFHNESLRQNAKEGNSGSGPLFAQTLNRYSYAQNAPHNYIDPSGHNELLFEGDVTVAEAREMLAGLEEGIEILEEVLYTWSTENLLALLDQFLTATGLASGFAALKNINNPAELAAAAFSLLQSISMAELSGAITGIITSTTGEMSAGALAAGLIGTLLVYAAIVSVVLGSATYRLVLVSIERSLADFRQMRNDLNSIIKTADAGSGMIHVAMSSGRWLGHKVAFSTTSSSGRTVNKSTNLSATPLQLFGLSSKDALLATWPSMMNSRFSN